MKKANFNAGSAIGGFKRWFGGSMTTMRSAWSLYRAVAGRTAVFAGVLLVLPYAVLIMLTMRAVSFDVGAGISMLTGVGYMGDWSRAIMGRLQAIYSLSSLLSYATDLFLLPCACAAFAFLYWMRWQGLSLDVKDVWARVKPRVGRIVITGLMVMFISNLVQMVGSLANGLISMVAGLLGFIPVVGSIVYALAYIASLLIVIAIALISLTALMFAMLNMADEDNGYSQSDNEPPALYVGRSARRGAGAGLSYADGRGGAGGMRGAVWHFLRYNGRDKRAYCNTCHACAVCVRGNTAGLRVHHGTLYERARAQRRAHVHLYAA